MAKIFLSYAPSDSTVVKIIASTVRDAGHIVKLGRSSIDVVDTGGRLAACALALKNCDVFVMVLSPAAVTCSAIVSELELAERTFKRIVPLIIEKAALPSEIGKSIRYLRKIDSSRDRLAAGSQLLAALDAWRLAR